MYLLAPGYLALLVCQLFRSVVLRYSFCRAWSLTFTSRILHRSFHKSVNDYSSRVPFKLDRFQRVCSFAAAAAFQRVLPKSLKIYRTQRFGDTLQLYAIGARS